MRKSKQEAAETRQRIVKAASAEFRRNGIGGTGLTDLMAAAGLTHGGFYKHFDSKDQVVEESVTLAAGSWADASEAKPLAPSGDRGLQAVIADYLSMEHRNKAAEGCPFVALGSELARSSESVREATTAGFRKFVDVIAGQLNGMSPAAAKKEALVMVCTMIGALTMARIVTNAELSASIVRQARKHLTR